MMLRSRNFGEAKEISTIVKNATIYMYLKFKNQRNIYESRDLTDQWKKEGKHMEK